MRRVQRAAGTLSTIAVPRLSFGALGAQAAAKRRHLIVAPPPPSVAPAPEPVEPDTLTAFAVSYFRAKAPVLAANTIRNREDDYRRRIAPVLGHLPLGAISREVVEVWLAELVANGASHRMVKQTVATLRVILATAVEWGRIAENPARRLRLPSLSPGQRAVERVLDHDQVAALIEGAGDLRTATMLQVAAGAPPWRAGRAALGRPGPGRPAPARSATGGAGAPSRGRASEGRQPHKGAARSSRRVVGAGVRVARARAAPPSSAKVAISSLSVVGSVTPPLPPASRTGTSS